MSVAPPPDLAIEIDLTSKTDTEIYEALGVPELWRYDNGRFRMDVLKDGRYVQVRESSIFPGWPITNLVAEYVTRAREVGQGKANREFRQRVRDSL